MNVLKLLGLRLPGTLGVLRAMGWSVGALTTAELATIPCDVTREGEERRVEGSGATASRKVRCEWDGAAYAWEEVGRAALDDRYVNTAGDTMTGNLTIQRTTSATLSLETYVGSATPLSILSFNRSRGALGAHGLVSSGDNVALIIAAASDGDQFAEVGSIFFEVDGVAANNDMPGRMILATTPDGQVFATEKVRLGHSSVVVNETGAAHEFRVESDTLTSALRIDPDTGEPRLGFLGGTGSRVVVADPEGDLSATISAEAVSSVTLGPWYAQNLVGTAADAAMLLQYMPTTTSVGTAAATGHHIMPRAGRVVGAFAVSNENRSAGTATIRLDISGVGTFAIGAGACVMNGTNLARCSAWDSAGPTFTAGQVIRPVVTTSGWTPTTADIVAWLVVRFDP